MNHTWFQFTPCSVEGCERLALTGLQVCWQHCEEREAHVSHIVERLKSGECGDEWVLEGCDFSQQDLSGTRLCFAHCAGINLDGATLRDCNLLGINLQGARLHKTTFENANLERAILGLADCTEASFLSATLKRSNLVATKAHRAVFRNADLFYARPACADCTHADFTGANLHRAVFRKASLAHAILTDIEGTPKYDQTDLTEVTS